VVFVRLGGQNGVMACGMEAQNGLGARGMFDPEALSADGTAAIGADLNGGAETPNIRPPGAARGWAQDGSFFRVFWQASG
jgi:hypothetical protein